MISRRALETATALLTGIFGAAVAVSSVDVGIGWSSAGVDAGTFPFLTGLIILLGSAFNLIAGWRGNVERALERAEISRIAALFVPAAIFVGLIPLIGMYVASGSYMFATLLFQNRWSAARSLAMAIIVSLSLYLIFERMFQVALPHGILGAGDSAVFGIVIAWWGVA
jgi:hypothetical protein